MTAGQFHLEAELDEHVSSHCASVPSPKRATEAGITSLLVGVAARGWLTDREREFLDSLVGDRQICLLACDGSYLHPESVPLLSPELLEASYLEESAIFSHRHRLDSGTPSGGRVQASRLGELAGKQLTLGVVGNESYGRHESTADAFAQLVGIFRDAILQLRPLISRVTEALDSRLPVLVVNRSSGRIIAANKRAVSVIPAGDHHEIVDREFGECRELLSELFNRHNLQADNLHFGGIELSLVTFRTRQRPAGEAAEELFPRFIQNLRRATQALHSTAHHLESIIAWQPGHPETELLRLIHEETSELEQIVHRYQLLTMLGHLRSERVNPADELRKRVTHVAIHHPDKQLSMSEQWSEPMQLELPPEALAVLYETVLEIHMTATGSQTATVVELEVNRPGEVVVSIATRPLQDGRLMHSSSDWGDYIISLGKLLGFEVEHRFADGTQIETILTHHKDSRPNEQHNR